LTRGEVVGKIRKSPEGRRKAGGQEEQLENYTVHLKKVRTENKEARKTLSKKKPFLNLKRMKDGIRI